MDFIIEHVQLTLIMKEFANDAPSPMFAEIVRAHARMTIYALDRSFESVLALFTAPVVGLLAERYTPTSAAGQERVINRENALSLSKALYTAMGIPLTLCCLIYTLLYWTYQCDRDRDRARALALAASDHEFHKVKENELQTMVPEEDDYYDGDHDRSLETQWMFKDTKSTDQV